MSEVIKNRYDFVILFDVENGNPNGDPDAGNQPRIDWETNHGIVTDVCIKRKIRNYVEACKAGATGYRIYITNDSSLEDKNTEAYTYLGVDQKEIKVRKKSDMDFDGKIRDFMCDNFFDIRTFGGVMTTFVANNLNCGQIKGPVQLFFAKSVDEITIQEITITRQAVASNKEREEGKQNMIGRKYIVPYALYRMEGSISAHIAQTVTRFTEDDLELLWNAIINMFDVEHASLRGKMTVRELIIFRHDSKLGNAPLYKLLDRIQVHKVSEGVPRSYRDYKVEIMEEDIPTGVSVIRK